MCWRAAAETDYWPATVPAEAARTTVRTHGHTTIFLVPMIRLARSLRAWGRPEFQDVIKNELEQLGTGQLPLQQGLTTGSVALDGALRVMITRVTGESTLIRVQAGIFYTSVIAGCSCADDPTPVEAQNEYCEVQIDIDRLTADTTVTLLK